MKLKWDSGSFFLATGIYTSDDERFEIEIKTEDSHVSAYLQPEHAKMLRDEIDKWLEFQGAEEPSIDLFEGMDLDTTYSDQLSDAIDNAYKEDRYEKRSQ